MSLLRVCDHRMHTDDAVWYLYQIVEQKLLSYAAEHAAVIDAAAITEQASTALKRFDAAAYVKYLSYHQPALDAVALGKKLRKK